jgi:hypothetical protein
MSSRRNSSGFPCPFRTGQRNRRQSNRADFLASRVKTLANSAQSKNTDANLDPGSGGASPYQRIAHITVWRSEEVSVSGVPWR